MKGFRISGSSMTNLGISEDQAQTALCLYKPKFHIPSFEPEILGILLMDYIRHHLQNIIAPWLPSKV